MKNFFSILVLVLTCTFGSFVLAASTFENNGIIIEVRMGSNEIVIDEQIYHLPNTVTIDNISAILILEPGDFVSFSGITGASNYIIENIHRYNQEAETEINEKDSP